MWSRFHPVFFCFFYSYPLKRFWKNSGVQKFLASRLLVVGETRVPTPRSPWAETPTPPTEELGPGPRQEGGQTRGAWGRCPGSMRKDTWGETRSLGPGGWMKRAQWDSKALQPHGTEALGKGRKCASVAAHPLFSSFLLLPLLPPGR
uniref:Uncharacterized protein n=1 Tax=Myotis myotis TaxID=51298 RepID=A0A7J7QSK8_MYOMY|nr:hypothetical protein mMyoMyo1_012003 [Myotis myotis]